MASSRSRTTLTERMRSPYSVDQSSSRASLSEVQMARAFSQPRSSTPAASIARTRRGRNSSAMLSCTSSVSIALQTDGRETFAFRAIFSAMARSALSSTKVWQTPLPVSRTGTVLPCTTARMRPAPPRGITTSKRPSRCSIASTPCRSAESMKPIAPAGTPASCAACARSDAIAVFERIASLPPRSSTALPDFRQSPAASDVTLGRAS